MNTYLKYAAAVAAVVVLAVVGLSIYSGSPDSNVGAQPATPSPSVAPSPSRAPSPSVAPSPVAVDSPIVGAYATSFSKDEFVADPGLYDQGEINDENWGDFTLTLGGDGRVTLFQSNALTSSFDIGSYAIDGDHIELAFTQGPDKGQTFGGHWILDGDTLTFERIDCRDTRVPCFPGGRDAPGGLEALPTYYLVKAWTRQP